MRIGIGAIVSAWDGSDIKGKLVDLLNEFYLPTTRFTREPYFADSDGEIMEVGDANAGYIKDVVAIAHIRNGIDATKKLMLLAAKRIEEAENELQSIISTCGEQTGYFNGYDTYKDYLESDHWEEVRAEALKRYDGRCALDASHANAVHVHHRTYDRLGAELSEDVIVLCSACHAKHHEKEGV